MRSISLDLLDDKLTSIWIGFDETFKAHTVEEFVKLISQSLQVDGNWSSGDPEDNNCAALTFS